MKEVHNNISGKLNELPNYQVNKEKDQEILKALENRRIEQKYEQSKSFNFLTPFFMSAKKLVAVVAALVLVVSGVFYYNATNTYAYHLNKAKSALHQLESVVDEEAVEELTEEIVKRTEAAIEALEKIDNPGKTAFALEQVSEVQAAIIDVLSDAVEVIEDEDVAEAVAEAIETTAEEQEEVEEALEGAEEAVENSEEEVDVEIETSEDTGEDKGKREEKKAEKAEEATLNAEEAKAAFASLSDSGDASDEEVEKLESKLAKVEIALEEGKIGRAKGLSIAIQAKAKNIHRKAEKEAEGEEGDESDEDEEVDEESSSSEEEESDEAEGVEETSAPEAEGDEESEDAEESTSEESAAADEEAEAEDPGAEEISEDASVEELGDSESESDEGQPDRS